MGTAALESHVFLTFARIVATLLVSGGALITVARATLGKELTSIRRTYRSWWIMAPLPFVAVLLGREATILLGLGLSCLIFCEFAAATGLRNDRFMKCCVLAAIVVQFGVTLMPDPRLGTPGWYGMFMTLPAFSICGIALLPILRNRSQGQLQSVSLAAFGYLYFGWMFGHLAFLANSTHAIGYLLYLFFAVSVADISAFTCGNIIGRRSLRSEISPNKTIAGAIGGLLVSLALPWLLSFALPEFTASERVLTGLIVGVGGQLGDLTISYIKRDVGVKDMGSLIPGHGGLLDRLDSLIFTAPLFFHMVRWFHGI